MGSSSVFIAMEPVLDILFMLCLTYRVCGCMFGHSILKKYLHVLDIVIMSPVGAGKNMNRLSIHYMSVML